MLGQLLVLADGAGLEFKEVVIMVHLQKFDGANRGSIFLAAIVIYLVEVD
jgi:hypothetical protein